jgi:hypothetical protein
MMLPQLLSQYNHSFYSWINGAEEDDNDRAESVYHTTAVFKAFMI